MFWDPLILRTYRLRPNVEGRVWAHALGELDNNHRLLLGLAHRDAILHFLVPPQRFLHGDGKVATVGDEVVDAAYETPRIPLLFGVGMRCPDLA